MTCQMTATASELNRSTLQSPITIARPSSWNMQLITTAPLSVLGEDIPAQCEVT